MIKILVAGDLCPNGRYEKIFSDNAIDFYKSIEDDIKSSDLFIANLECPLTNNGKMIRKVGVHLKANVNCIKGILGLKVDALNLANNHINDYGESGINSTIKVLEQNNIEYFGLGKTVEEANKIYIKNIKGKRIAFWSCAEREFSIVGHISSGANPIDLINFNTIIKKKNITYDHLIILIHGGKENYPYPSPGLQRICRYFADEGASAIIVQHTHIVGAYEKYNDTPIIYGQGNFIFDGVSGCLKNWWFGMLVCINIVNNKISMDFIPLKQLERKIGIQKLKNSEKEGFIDGFMKRSEKIKNPNFVYNRWEKLCLIEEKTYLRQLRPYIRYIRYFLKITSSSISHNSC